MSSKRLKILMLGWEFPPALTGGLGTACYGLAKALSKYADITLILPHSDKDVSLENVNIVGLNNIGPDVITDKNIDTPPLPYEAFADVTYINADLDPYPVGYAFSKHDQPVTSAEDIRALYGTREPYGPNIMTKVATYADVVTKIALEKDFDAIHAHDWITFPAAVKIKEATNKPLVLHVHSLETDRVGTEAAQGWWNTVYEIERVSMEKADKIISVSNYTKECAVKYYGSDPGKFYPVHNAIDKIDTFKTERETKEKIVLFLGRITFQKGPEYMVETAYKVLLKQPDVKFFVAGVGDKLDELVNKTKARGIYDNFIFAGFLNKDKVKQILAQADVYFMPSVSEPFGLSALEAAQFDIPCVLSTQSGVAEVMQHSLKADYWDTDRFANYIYALLNYEGIRQDLVENNKEDIDEMSWDDSAKEVLSVYESVL